MVVSALLHTHRSLFYQLHPAITLRHMEFYIYPLPPQAETALDAEIRPTFHGTSARIPVVEIPITLTAFALGAQTENAAPYALVRHACSPPIFFVNPALRRKDVCHPERVGERIGGHSAPCVAVHRCVLQLIAETIPPCPQSSLSKSCPCSRSIGYSVYLHSQSR